MLWDIYKREKTYKVLASYDEMYIAGNNMVKINNLLLIENSVYSCRSYIQARKQHTFLSSCSVAGLVGVRLWFWWFVCFCFFKNSYLWLWNFLHHFLHNWLLPHYWKLRSAFQISASEDLFWAYARPMT